MGGLEMKEEGRDLEEDMDQICPSLRREVGAQEHGSGAPHTPPPFQKAALAMCVIRCQGMDGLLTMIYLPYAPQFASRVDDIEA
jgi:hypothetical protein